MKTNIKIHIPHFRILGYFLLTSLLLFFTFTSCFEEDNKFANTNKGNFDALWKIMDEKYCFFEYKEVDWNKVYNSYSPRISEDMGRDAFFYLLGDMLSELKDGHVNLSSAFDRIRYWKWYEDYPDNFDEKIQRNYIGTDYGIAGGLKYKILADNIGYIHYSSFSNGLGESNLNQVLMRMATCDGIILDIRQNGGGFLTYSERLASHFITEKTLVGYIQHKTGKGHSDFSKPYEKYVEPSNGVRYLKTVTVLTNRRCYSAANDFVSAMTYAPHAILVGDKTGGGSGMPFSSELPNGWTVRFSASPMTNAERQHIEFGIDPDVKVDMLKSDIQKGLDTIIEEARRIIKENKYYMTN